MVTSLEFTTVKMKNVMLYWDHAQMWRLLMDICLKLDTIYSGEESKEKINNMLKLKLIMLHASKNDIIN